MINVIKKDIFSNMRLKEYNEYLDDYDEAFVIEFNDEVMLNIMFKYIEFNKYNIEKDKDLILEGFEIMCPDIEKKGEILISVLKKGNILFKFKDEYKIKDYDPFPFSICHGNFKYQVKKKIEVCDFIIRDESKLYLINLKLSSKDFLRTKLFHDLKNKSLINFLDMC